MPRLPKKTVTEQLALPKAAASQVQTVASAQAAPTADLIEFTLRGDHYRCARFVELAAEFGLGVHEVPDFWLAALDKPRAALIARRLFGLMPVIPHPGYAEDDCRVWGREELQTALGLTRAQLQAELDALRGHWQGRREKSEARSQKPEWEVAALKPTGDGTLGLFEDAEFLASMDYGTMRFHNLEERRWFTGRVQEWTKLLQEKMTRGIAREALHNELLLRRLEEAINTRPPEVVGQPEWTRLVNAKAGLQEAFSKRIMQLQEIAPALAGAASIDGKYGLQGMLSDLTLAMQEYHARGDTARIDGIFTALDIQILCRRSQQAPDPQYRAGHVVYLNAAKAGLWDANWKGQMPPALLAKINRAWQEAFVAACAAGGEQAVDLTATGPEGEYEKLRLAQPESSGL